MYNETPKRESDFTILSEDIGGWIHECEYWIEENIRILRDINVKGEILSSGIQSCWNADEIYELSKEMLHRFKANKRSNTQIYSDYIRKYENYLAEKELLRD